jgi:hypothetical protein
MTLALDESIQSFEVVDTRRPGLEGGINRETKTTINGQPALPQDLLCNIRDMFCGLDLSCIALRL